MEREASCTMTGVRVLLHPRLCSSGTSRLVPDDRVHAKWKPHESASLIGPQLPTQTCPATDTKKDVKRMHR